MSIELLGRRQFLTLAFLALGGRPAAGGTVHERRAAFAVDVGLMYDFMALHLAGTIHERVDRGAGTYRVEIEGQGDGIANRVDCHGVLWGGRWAPVRTATWVRVRGRESRIEATYEHDRGSIAYRARGETFLLRRLRVVDDHVAVPAGVRVDDAVSAALNYADELWPMAPDGMLRTHVVRRQREKDEGPDDVSATYRAGLVPLELRVAIDATTGRETALLDLAPFSSWARESQPAKVVFGPGRRPATITTSMILGTSLTVRLGGA
jgi:hypothetical protein